MASSRPMIHIKREDLYTSLESRIKYLHSFLDFSTSDIEALTTGAKYVRALIPAIVNIVYKKLLQYDITARSFTTRSTSFEGPIDEDPDEDSPQIVHRKMFLRAYLNEICSDPSRMEFWEYLDKRVTNYRMMHVGLGRQHPLHIEYIHLGVCLGFIQDIMTEAILSHPRLSLQRKTALVKALNKVIWIQNDLMAKWHVEDGIECEIRRTDFEREREGYLHGRKVLATGADEAVAKISVLSLENSNRDKLPSSTCPFSGLCTGQSPHVSESKAANDAPAGRDGS